MFLSFDPEMALTSVHPIFTSLREPQVEGGRRVLIPGDRYTGAKVTFDGLGLVQTSFDEFRGAFGFYIVGRPQEGINDDEPREFDKDNATLTIRVSNATLVYADPSDNGSGHSPSVDLLEQSALRRLAFAVRRLDLTIMREVLLIVGTTLFGLALAILTEPVWSRKRRRPSHSH
jgi:hypothetical protein